MSHGLKHKLSLSEAILININIILGAGIFINTAELAKRSAFLGGFNYIVVGLLMLPLIISIAYLVNLHPSGGFYTYGNKEINPFIGFLTTWSYFIGKLGSCAIMIYASILLLQHSIQVLSFINPLVLSLFVIGLFTAFNTLNVQTGSSIQKIFTIFKILPIAFAIFVCLFLFNTTNVIVPVKILPGIMSSLPLVIYAMIGFEAACSLSSHIEDAQKNAPLAILISYSIVLLTAFIYQLLFYGALGSYLATLNYRDVFPALLQTVLPASAYLQYYLTGVFDIAIATSALGGAYGIMFSNNWNLYKLAQHNHIISSTTFTKLNSHHIPTACVITEGLICALYLLVTGGAQVPLQQLGALGVSLAYTGAVTALFVAKIKKPELSISLLVPTLGLGCCAILVGSCIMGMLNTSIAPLIAFSFLLTFGASMFAYNQTS